MWKIYNFKNINNMGSLKNTFKKTALTQMHFSILIVCMEKELNVNSKCTVCFTHHQKLLIIIIVLYFYQVISSQFGSC